MHSNSNNRISSLSNLFPQHIVIQRIFIWKYNDLFFLHRSWLLLYRLLFFIACWVRHLSFIFFHLNWFNKVTILSNLIMSLSNSTHVFFYAVEIIGSTYRRTYLTWYTTVTNRCLHYTTLTPTLILVLLRTWRLEEEVILDDECLIEIILFFHPHHHKHHSISIFLLRSAFTAHFLSLPTCILLLLLSPWINSALIIIHRLVQIWDYCCFLRYLTPRT